MRVLPQEVERRKEKSTLVAGRSRADLQLGSNGEVYSLI